MTSEATFIAALRAIVTTPDARGLVDDAAVIEIGVSRLVLTMDALVEGVHYLPDDPPGCVAWKLVATNVSDLAAKGALPRGCLLSYPLADDDDWDAAFVAGLRSACDAFAIPLLGGDTVRPPAASARNLALVALGEPRAGVPVPCRSGAQAGDLLYVSGTIGDSGAGLALLQDKVRTDPTTKEALIRRYRRPAPSIALGVALASLVHAMMDVSDGVLIDAARLADASAAGVLVDLDRLPLSAEFVHTCGRGLEARQFAASAGDDYCLMFAAPPEAETALHDAAARAGCTIHVIGQVTDGGGLKATYEGEPVPLPARLGFEH